jgi:hypothetical protein
MQETMVKAPVEATMLRGKQGNRKRAPAATVTVADQAVRKEILPNERATTSLLHRPKVKQNQSAVE